MSASPTSRSLAECKKRGWRAQVVERRLPRNFISIDLFGFGDIIALDGKPGSLLIQACRTADMATRTKKIWGQCYDAAEAWLDAGNRIEVWGFAKRGAKGKRKLWTLRRVEVTLEDGEPARVIK